MNVIAFSLWGDSPRYTLGALQNASLAKIVYPDWVCRFYIGKSVPYPFIHQLRTHENVEVIEKEELGDWK